jgi:hypothetical protein
MNIRMQAWVGQITTGQGVMILAPTVMAVMSGSMTWETALPLLVAGVTGLIWPESTTASVASQAAAKDIQALIVAYRTGLDHAGSEPVAPASVVPAHGPTVAGMAALAIGAAALAGCANQTPAQTQASMAAVASGLVCVADTSGKVVAITSTTDPTSVKALNAAIAAGGALTTDATCQAAAISGAAALTAPAKPVIATP